MEVFGAAPDGREIHALEISGGALSVRLLTLGACLQDARLDGVPHSLTLGFDSPEPYLGELFHVGTIMGPVANRITGARAEIDGAEYRFDANFMGRHTLHGGSAATHARVWDVVDAGAAHAVLRTALPDGEGGFPGAREITARFEAEGGALTLTLEAATDRPTLMNLANHSYWNLGPDPTTLGHRLRAAADRYLPGDPETTIPLGSVEPVEGTRFDFRGGRDIEAGREGLLDLNLCLSDAREPLREVATLTGSTGISMDMATTEPGLQVFDGHILGGAGARTLDGEIARNHAALALEAQFWPDAPTNPGFPDITLRPGEPWKQVTRWTFRT